jgi:putative aldouronate transport system permease protein
MENVCRKSALTVCSKGTRSKKQFHRFVANLPLTLMALPAVIYFALFHYMPMGGIIIAFKKYSYAKGILGSTWIGFRNFTFFFTSQDAWRITRNTVGYSAIFIVTGIIGAVTVALLLYEIQSRLATKFYQTAMIIPNFLSWVVVGYITYSLFNPVLGILNQVITFFGFQPVQWYSKPHYWPFILPLVNLWKSVGINSVVYYAALMGINKELYEAAEIDGASRWRQTLAISIPSLVPVIVVLFILAVGGIFKGDFGLFYEIPRDIGLLYPTTDVIDTYLYRGLRGGEIGITSAVGLFQSVVGFVMVLCTNGLIKKISPENAMF